MEDFKTKKQWLNQYCFYCSLLDSKIEEKKQWEDRLTNITPTYSDLPKGGNESDKVASGVAAIQDIKNDLSKDIANVRKSKAEIEQAIYGMEDGTFKTILIMRYINNKRWEEISVATHFNYSYVHELHRRAIEAIRIVKDA